VGSRFFCRVNERPCFIGPGLLSPGEVQGEAELRKISCIPGTREKEHLKKKRGEKKEGVSQGKITLPSHFISEDKC